MRSFPMLYFTVGVWRLVFSGCADVSKFCALTKFLRCSKWSALFSEVMRHYSILVAPFIDEIR
jgi:hypothetical protein